MAKHARSLSGSITDNVQVSAHAVVEAGQEAVARSSDAIQHILHYDQLPEWMKVDSHIKLGYRRQLDSFRDCFWSLFYLHNEFINIWSHLLPAIGYLVLLLKLDFETIHSGIKIPALDIAIFELCVISAVVCLLLSAIYHSINSHSEPIYRIFLKLDYLGIVLHVMGTNIAAAYFGLYGKPRLQGLYVLFIVICAAHAFYRLWRNNIDGPGAVFQRYTILQLCLHISKGWN